MKLTYEYIKKYFLDNNCELLENIYINNKTKMKYKCKCENISYIRFIDFKNGKRCKLCGYDKTSNTNKYHQIHIEIYLKKYNYTLLNQYKNSKTKIKIKCPNDHILNIKFNDFQQGSRCKICYRMFNVAENHPSWIHDRSKISKLKEIHRLSNKYKVKYKKSMGIINDNIHVDHIFPIKAFVDHKIYDLQIINSYDNLQLLEANINRKKSATYDKEKFYNYLRRHDYTETKILNIKNNLN